MGGDKYIIFMQYNGDPEPQVKRIFNCLTKPLDEFDVSISMGIALAEHFCGDYDALFRMADTAQYTVKRGSKCNYCFYDDSMESVLPSADQRKDER